MTEKNIIKLIILHIAIGLLISQYPFLAKIYAVLIVVFGVFIVIENQNKNNEVLYIIAYLVGSEVFLRTSHELICYEYVKYFMLFFTGLGIFYDGIPKIKNPYWLFLIFIIPGIFIPLESLHGDVKKKIIFDILGPVCVGFCSLYTYKKTISNQELQTILAFIVLPLVACCVFLMVCYPYYDGVIINGESNYYLSGKFAPNQMATILGLGTFICFILLLLVSYSKKTFFLILAVLALIYYRGLFTFSRGGMFTCFAIIAIFLVSLFLTKEKHNHINKKFILMLLILSTLFIVTNYQTNSQLVNRYLNININGIPKNEEVNGREHMALEEIKFFKENPLLGMGVGTAKEIRKIEYGKGISTHNEITRMLAEHGILGVLSLLILFVFPIVLYFKNRQNSYLLSFFAFWLLTVNHSAMRIAAPAFLYALSLLDVRFTKTNEPIKTETYNS